MMVYPRISYSLCALLFFWAAVTMVQAQVPPNPAIRVEFNASDGRHFRILKFQLESNWTDINNKQVDANDSDTPFFPIGWYVTSESTIADFQAMADAGVNTALIQITPSSSVTAHTTALKNYITTLQSYGIKCFIHLSPFLEHLMQPTNSEFSSYTLAALTTFMNEIKTSTTPNYNQSVLGYYAAEEIDNYYSDPVKVQIVHDFINSIRAIDNHRLIFVDCHPQILPLSINNYDALGTQLYSINTYNYGYTERVQDYNLLSMRSAQGVNRVQSDNRSGFIGIMSGQDRNSLLGFHAMTPEEELYQTISPIVNGARGLLYWWHHSRTTSPALKTMTHQAAHFLTSKDNIKGTSLVEALMSDPTTTNKDRTSLVELSNIRIDGNTSVSIHGANQNLTNKADLMNSYKYNKFNKFERGGSVYRCLSGSNQWVKVDNGFAGGCINPNISSWMKGRTIWGLLFANDKLFAAVEDCYEIWTMSSSSNWSLSSSDNANDCGINRNLILSFGILPPNNTVVTVDQSGYWYKYNASGTTGCTRWPRQGVVQAVQNGVSYTALQPRCFLTINGTLYVGCQNGLFSTSDGGSTWNYHSGVGSVLRSNNIYTGGATEPYSVLSLATDQSNRLYVGSVGRMFVYDGTTWIHLYHDKYEYESNQTTDTEFPNQPIYSVINSGNTTFIGTEDGLYYNTNVYSTTNKWLRVNGLPARTAIWSMTINAATIYAASNMGIYAVNTSTYNASSFSAGLPIDPTLDVTCRTIVRAPDGNMYVGTIENGNSYANVQAHTTDIDASIENSNEAPLFNYIVRKHQGSYYVFAANNFRPTISATFILDNVLDKNETIFRVSQLNMDGTETQDNSGGYRSTGWVTEGLPGGITRAGFAASFNAYEAKVFRIDVIKWSDSAVAVNRECEIFPLTVGYIDPCTTHAGGVTVGNFDDPKDSEDPIKKHKDILFMWVPNVVNGPEPIRYKIAWNLRPSPNGEFSFDGTRNLTFDADNAVARVNFDSTRSPFDPDTCYGELIGNIAEEVRGGDVKAFYYGGEYPNRSEIFFMAMGDQACGGCTPEYRIRVGWDIQGSSTTRVQLGDNSLINFPTTAYGKIARPNIPTGTAAGTGGGITLYESVNQKNLLVMHLKDEAGANGFSYSLRRNLTQIPNTSLGEFQPPTPNNYMPVTSFVTPANVTPGWDTEGAGMDIGNLYPAYGNTVDKYKELVFGGIEISSNELRYTVYNYDILAGVSDQTWRPAITVPITPEHCNAVVKDAGLALADIDGDGDDDMIIMAIAQECRCAKNSPASPMFVRVGINKLKNTPGTSFVKAGLSEEPEVQQIPVERANYNVGTTLQSIPNPLQDNAVVHYSIDQQCHIELDVYSMLGEVVLHQNVGVQQPGSYSIPFDAGSLPNGIYICRLKANGTVVNSAKMVLAR